VIESKNKIGAACGTCRGRERFIEGLGEEDLMGRNDLEVRGVGGRLI